MSKDTIKVNMNVYDIPIVVEQLKKLEKENIQLIEELEELKDAFDFNLGAIENIRKGKNELEDKIDKAIEYIKELLSDTKGVLKDYMYHKEHNKILIELLKEDEQIYIKLLEILGDKE